jgi:DNA-binding LytR/AlgR family response regulator
VGHTAIGFFIIAKIILVNLAPPIALRIFRLTHEMRLENNLLVKEKSILQQQLQSIADANKLITIEFYSTDNQSEALKLALSDIVLVKSADNYVEIYYKDNSGNRKKLIRNTLKNVEQLLSPYALFIRCHRTCIINTGYIDKLYHKINSSYILVKELDERIPVSRQYILKLKEATAKMQG